MAKQSIEDKVARLNDGCCPIHGIGMSQEGNFGDIEEDRAVVGCPRGDCNVKGLAASCDSPVELLPEFSALLTPAPSYRSYHE